MNIGSEGVTPAKLIFFSMLRGRMASQADLQNVGMPETSSPMVMAVGK